VKCPETSLKHRGLTAAAGTVIIRMEKGGSAMRKAHRGLRLGIALAALTIVAAPYAGAGVIASKAEATVPPTRAQDLRDVKELLARDEVGKALAAHGLSADEVDQRLDRLSDQDLRALAANIDQIQAAGDVPKYIWILLAIFLAVSILVLIF
jgi:hypothetical protein